MDIREKKPILVTCGPGLMPYLKAELGALGFEAIDSHPGGVTVKGSLIDCMKLNLLLRTAYNVLYLLKEFRCGNAETLYKQVYNLPWDKTIASDRELSVITRANTWAVDNTMYPSLKVKDAIVDKIQNKTGARPDSGTDRTGVVINLFWKDDRAWLYLNTSGVKLSDRGYRKMPHMAPLRESLAAGLLTAAEYDGSQDIVLPMCGSGTLAIEAALIATNKAPGLLRNSFGLQYINQFDEEIFKQLRNDIRKQAAKTCTNKIIATDIDPKAIEAAKQNALTAGVDHLIEFGVCDFADTNVPQGKGIVMMNPEYGQRLGDTNQLQKEYKRIGDFFKQKCPGYTGYVFTGNLGLIGKIGLTASGNKMTFFNGNIKCRLARYELYSGTLKRDEQLVKMGKTNKNPGIL